VSGYQGVQKLAPSKLIKYLPANKVKLAAKRVLVASGVRPSSSRKGRKGGKGKKKKGGKKRRIRRRRKT